MVRRCALAAGAERANQRWAIASTTRTNIPTNTQPTRKPASARRLGMRISKLVPGKSARLGGTMAPFGKVQGALTVSPGVMGVRMSA